ncbi:MAG: fumarylacetoacetate hydrolase family protein [Steroidobacteraceae bacterium]
MRLVTFSDGSNTTPRIGILSGDNTRVVDVGAAAASLQVKLPFDANDMLSLIAQGQTALDALKQLSTARTTDLALSACKLYAPIPRPRKNIFCVGWNYQDHFNEGASMRTHVKEMPAYPTLFTKAPTAVTGPYDTIPFHHTVSSQLDWEAELGVIIGRSGINISSDTAMQHVFGYTVINDLSWRDIQKRHGQQWFKGKSLDGSCPMGPWIVTADEVEPNSLAITCRVNGVVKQSSNTQYLYFKLPRIIAELSAGLTLESGDIISTGTPAGVGQARDPQEFMKPGDVVETEVAGVGLLRNQIGQ